MCAGKVAQPPHSSSHLPWAVRETATPTCSRPRPTAFLPQPSIFLRSIFLPSMPPAERTETLGDRKIEAPQNACIGQSNDQTHLVLDRPGAATPSRLDLSPIPPGRLPQFPLGCPAFLCYKIHHEGVTHPCPYESHLPQLCGCRISKTKGDGRIIKLSATIYATLENSSTIITFYNVSVYANSALWNSRVYTHISRWCAVGLSRNSSLHDLWIRDLWNRTFHRPISICVSMVRCSLQLLPEKSASDGSYKCRKPSPNQQRHSTIHQAPEIARAQFDCHLRGRLWLLAIWRYDDRALAFLSV